MGSKEHKAKDAGGVAVCPYCGDTLVNIDDDGYAFCLHDGIDIYVPKRLR